MTHNLPHQCVLSICRTQGCNPVECRAVEQYLSTTAQPVNKDHQLLATLQGMMASRLKGRACKTLVGLGRELADSSTVTKQQLEHALRNYHISLTVEVMCTS